MLTGQSAGAFVVSTGRVGAKRDRHAACLKGATHPHLTGAVGASEGDMEPLSPAALVRWLEHTIEGLADEVTSLRARLRVLVQQSPALDGADQEAADLMRRQLETMERQYALIRAQVAHLRTELTGDAPAGTTPPASTEAPEPQQGANEPDEA